ncbi:iron-sulfur cluster assembly scaffold protein [Rudaea sp.]|uniref:iron-sulfur cluster assembly scaffold protein n=1 Tax=Rudaea sp. TaxID=2136325 RepID=UPI002ED13DBB
MAYSPSNLLVTEMTVDTLAFYHDVVLKHSRDPRGFGTLVNYTHAADTVNALCGDRLRVEANCAGGSIAELRFSGEACAISIASASMMSEAVVGNNATEVFTLFTLFSRFIARECDGASLPVNLRCFSPLRHHAARRDCALLPWTTLLAALAPGDSLSNGAKHGTATSGVA